MQQPTIGRIVIYRSRTGKYSVPAIITCTKESLYQPGVDGGHMPDLTEEGNVHLTVFTPGKPGKRGDAQDFEARAEAPISENVAGCYQEWDVPFIDTHMLPEGEDQPAGTWSWPTRV